MTSVVEHALLGLAVAALVAAALRAAALTQARGLQLALAAAPLAAAAAVIEALALGLAGLGGSSIALAAAAVATWGLAVWALEAPDPRPAAELRDWWRSLEARRRIGVGAMAGTTLAYTLFVLRFPVIGGDGLHYHLPDIAGWVVDGHTGSAVDYFDDLPTGSYPLTNEVLISWAAGLSGGMTPIALWPIAGLVLLAVACWEGIRRIELPAWVGVLATSALVSSPLLLLQANGPSTDIGATAWVVTAAALATGVRARPGLLGPIVVAVALAIGTKTTAVAPAALVVAAGLLALRGRPRPSLRALALPLTAALLVGTPWYIRNVLSHGSPLWPLSAGPFGDPVPPVLDQIDGRLISDLGSIPERADDYAAALGGMLVLVGGALLAPLLARRREVLLATGAMLACTLVWICAPYTGYPRGPGFDSLAAGAVRYLLPTLGTATLVLALAARHRGPARLVSASLLAGALLWNVERDAQVGFPFLPSAAYLLGAGVLGALIAMALRPLARAPLPPRSAVAAAVLLACAALAVPADGFVRRHMRILQVAEAPARWIAGQPAFSDGNRPVWAAGTVNGALAGDRFEHRVRLLPRYEGCPDLRRRARTAWVVLPNALVRPPTDAPPIAIPPATARRLARLRACLATARVRYRDLSYLVYGPAD